MASLRITDADRDEHGAIKTTAHPPATPRAIDPFDHTPLNLAVEADPAHSPATDQPTRIAPRLLRIGGIIGLLVAGLVIILIAVSPAGPRALPMGAPTRGQGAPTAAAPTSAPTAAPTAPVPTTTPPIAAFFGVGANRAPDIAAGTPLTYTARWGADWAQVTAPGGGQVWIARGQAAIDDRAFNALPDAAPQPTPAPARVIVREVPGAPPPCATADDIRFTSPRDVVVDGLTIGHVEGRSCYSQNEADRTADLLAQAQVDAYRQRRQP